MRRQNRFGSKIEEEEEEEDKEERPRLNHGQFESV